jgi:predicted glutamine amidotransferase
MFLDEIGFNEQASLEEMRTAMLSTLGRIMQLRQQHGADTSASMNFGVSNGLTTVVTRFSSHSGAKPASLFYAKGRLVESESGDFRIMPSDDPKMESLIIASEPLTDVISDWAEVERNHMLVADQNIHLTVEPISLSFQDEM